MSRPERKNDSILSRGRLELEIEFSAETLPQGQPEGSVQPTAERSMQHQVHPTLISQWKRHALGNLASLFEGSSDRREPDVEAITSPLYEQIGRLKVELDWVKKKSGGLT